MIHKFILILIIGNTSHTAAVTTLGEYESVELCQSAASAVKKYLDEKVFWEYKFICAAKN
jgi:hypothetical protein